MQNDRGDRWVAGAIANGHVLTAAGNWAPLNLGASHAGPWSPGDVVNDCAFTGTAWVQLPAGWRPDPAGRYQLRWWTGSAWSHHVMSNGQRFSESAPPAARPLPIVPPSSLAPRRSLGFWDVVDKFLFSGWVLFWLIVAVGSAWVAWQEEIPKLLLLTATASANVFAYKLTGRSWREFKKRLNLLPYLICGVLAAVGVWMSLHFEDPGIFKVTMVVVSLGLFFSWALS